MESNKFLQALPALVQLVLLSTLLPRLSAAMKLGTRDVIYEGAPPAVIVITSIDKTCPFFFYPNFSYFHRGRRKT